MAQVLRDNAPRAGAAAKEAIVDATEVVVQSSLLTAESVFQKVHGSVDAAEGPRAFAEKRKPVRKGA